MAVTGINEVQEQVQKFWGPLISQELREKTLLAGLVSKDYVGEIKKGGDSVYVTELDDAIGSLKTVGIDADSFDSEPLNKSRITIKADKRAVAAFEFDDLVELQSQIGQADSKIRQSLMRGIDVQINDYLYSLVAPSAAAPDHQLTGVIDFNASQVSNLRKLGAIQKWPRDKQWFILADPTYYSDVLNSTTLTNSDYGANDAPVIGGQIVNKRFGWNILEDDSRGVDEALAFHPNFMHLVMQQQAQFKVSSLHSQKRFGFLISVDLIFGAAAGHNGDLMSITVRA